MTRATDAQFGRLPRWWITGGLWAQMKPSDLAVAGVLVVHADRDGIAWPSLETIATLAGIRRTVVIEAIKRLTRLGVITIKRGGGRGRSNTYQLILNSPQAMTVSDDKTVIRRADKQSAPEHETVSVRAVNSHHTMTPTDNRTEKEQTAATERAADAADAGAAGGCEDERREAIRSALEQAGVGGQAMDRLAAEPWLTAAVVKHLAKRASTGRNPGGLLVTLIDAEGKATADKLARSGERLKHESGMISREAAPPGKYHDAGNRLEPTPDEDDVDAAEAWAKTLPELNQHRQEWPGLSNGQRVKVWRMYGQQPQEAKT